MDGYYQLLNESTSEKKENHEDWGTELRSPLQLASDCNSIEENEKEVDHITHVIIHHSFVQFLILCLNQLILLLLIITFEKSRDNILDIQELHITYSDDTDTKKYTALSSKY